MKALTFGKYKVKYINKYKEKCRHDIRMSRIREVVENFKYTWV